jgi:hypothetical protein
MRWQLHPQPIASLKATKSPNGRAWRPGLALASAERENGPQLCVPAWKSAFPHFAPKSTKAKATRIIAQIIKSHQTC